MSGDSLASYSTRPLNISLYKCREDNRPDLCEYTWDDLCCILERHQVKAQKEPCPAWSPAEFRPGSVRSKENVVSVHCLVLDLDSGVSTDAFKKEWSDFEFMAHSSFSHCEGHPKWRAVFPLAKPVAGGDWPKVYAKLSFRLGRGFTDPVCKDSCRIYYFPSCPPDRVSQKFVWAHAGDWLDSDEIPDLDLGEVKEYTDRQSSGRDGNSMPSLGKVNYKAIADATLPKGQRHYTLIRAILRARREDWPIEGIEHIIRQFHQRENDFGDRDREASLNYYLREIGHTWRSFQPDAKHTSGGAIE